VSPATDPGALSVRLTLEERQGPSDGAGGMADSWVEIARLWARVEPLSVAATERAGNRRGIASHRITVRPDPRVAPGRRFRKGGRIFLIEAAFDPDETGRLLACACIETD
jgi:SPP1 family predicted phage head-tail adaptor